MLISTSLLSFYLFLVGVTVQSAESLSAAIPLGTSTKRANSKRANHGRSCLFQDAVPFVSADDGHHRCLQCLGFQHAEDAFVDDSCACCGRMHDFAAISHFLSQRIGTLCRHPRWSLWLEQRTTGWRSGRSEGDSKSLSAG